MKQMLKVMGICLLAVAMMMFVTGCGEIKEAETVVCELFEAFQNYDFEAAQKYVNFDTIKEGANGETNIEAEKMMEVLFDRLDYQILESKQIDGDTVEVTVEITAVDMVPVLQDFFAKTIEYTFGNALTDPMPSEEETAAKVEELFVESATNPEVATVTNEVTVSVVRGEEGWKMKADDTFVNALFGGLKDAAENLSASFGE